MTKFLTETRERSLGVSPLPRVERVPLASLAGARNVRQDEA